jgi:hypothetical protein
MYLFLFIPLVSIVVLFAIPSVLESVINEMPYAYVIVALNMIAQEISEAQMY